MKGVNEVRELKPKPCPFCGAELIQDEYGNWVHPLNSGDFDDCCILSWIDPDYGAIAFRNDINEIRQWNRRCK